jgi:hypothetical protein
MKAWRSWPFYACVTVFSFLAALFLAADLGLRQLEDEQAESTAVPLCVYPKNESGSPELSEELFQRWEARTEIASVLPVVQLPAALSGHGFSWDVSLSAVPEDDLAVTGISLSSGRMPESAWEPELLLGANAARMITETAGQLPGRMRLYLAKPKAEAGKTQDIPAMDVRIAGTAAATGTAMDDGVWMDSAALQKIVDADKAFYQEQGIILKPVRADVYLNNANNAARLAAEMEQQGFLAVNPLQDWGELRNNGARARTRWGVLALAAGIAAFFAVRRYGRFSSLIAAAAGSCVSCAAGLLIASMLMQTAMLLSWTILDSNVRYMLNLPRCLALFAGCMVFTLSAYIPALSEFRPHRRSGKASFVP